MHHIRSICLSSALVIMLMAGCALDYSKNRAYLPPYKYQQAKLIYQNTQSLDIVRQILEQNQWYQSEINEALYRLQKEYEVIESEP